MNSPFSKKGKTQNRQTFEHILFFSPPQHLCRKNSLLISAQKSNVVIAPKGVQLQRKSVVIGSFTQTSCDPIHS